MGSKGCMIVKAWRMLPAPRFAARSIAWIVAVGAFASLAQAADPALVPQTEKLMLSGTGPDDAVLWDFRIDGGRKAGESARILVPSNWQQQGFGHYQYRYDKGRAPPTMAATGAASPSPPHGRAARSASCSTQ